MTDHRPTISVVIPTYNSEDTLDDCLSALLNQTYPTEKIELVIVDGGSKDRTLKICERYRARVVKNPFRLADGANGGKSIGLRSSNGEVVCFLDSDNVVKPRSFLESMVELMVNNPSVAICEPSRFLEKSDPPMNRYCSYYVQFTPSRDPFVPIFDAKPDRIVLKITKLGMVYKSLRSPPALANGAIIRRHLLEQVGGFDYDVEVSMRLTSRGYHVFARCTQAFVYHDYVRNLGELVRKAQSRASRHIGSTKSPGTIPILKGRVGSLAGPFLRSVVPLTQLQVALRLVRKYNDTACLLYPLNSFVVGVVYAFMLLSNRVARNP